MNIEQIIKAIDDWKVNESSFRLGLYEYGVYKGDEIVSFELEVYANKGSLIESNDRDIPSYYNESTLSIGDLKIIYYDGQDEFCIVTEQSTEFKIRELLIEKLYANHDV